MTQRDIRLGERLRALRRGAGGACPNCGARGLFDGYFTLKERCPGCALKFEREEGYWLGAMVVNLGLTETLFGIWLIGGLIVTWPEVPWTLLLVGGLVLNLVVPVTYYPLSKTTWIGLHLMFVPPEPSEEADAIAAQATRPDDGDQPADDRRVVGDGEESGEGGDDGPDVAGHPER